MKYRPVHIAIAALSVLTLSSRTAFAHCDTLDGPVVRDAHVRNTSIEQRGGPM